MQSGNEATIADFRRPAIRFSSQQTVFPTQQLLFLGLNVLGCHTTYYGQDKRSSKTSNFAKTVWLYDE